MSSLILVAMMFSQVNPPIEGKIKQLQKERIATLKELVDDLGKLYASGQMEYGELLDARMLLLKAELDAAEKSSERIAIYQKTIEGLKAGEELAQLKVQTGRGTNAAVLKLKARRLEVEILLEKEKAKEAKEKK